MSSQVVPNQSGHDNTSDGPTGIRRDIVFATDHEFIHQGCVLCDTGEDHVDPVHPVIAWL